MPVILACVRDRRPISCPAAACTKPHPMHHAGFFKPSKEYMESQTFGEYEDQPDPVGTTPKAIVVAWWDEDITDLARSLSIFLPRGSVVKVISAEKPEVGPGGRCMQMLRMALLWADARPCKMYQ